MYSFLILYSLFQVCIASALETLDFVKFPMI